MWSAHDALQVLHILRGESPDAALRVVELNPKRDVRTNQLAKIKARFLLSTKPVLFVACAMPLDAPCSAMSSLLLMKRFAAPIIVHSRTLLRKSLIGPTGCTKSWERLNSARLDAYLPHASHLASGIPILDCEGISKGSRAGSLLRFALSTCATASGCSGFSRCVGLRRV